MSLSPAWSDRINGWLNVMQTMFYQPLEAVPAEVFFTKDQLSARDASKRRFQKIQPGTEWGAKWEYGWFRFRVKTPLFAKGQRLMFSPGVGGESAVYVNGTAENAGYDSNWGQGSVSGAIDRQHHELLLSPKARPGEEFEILMESYAGHGPQPCGGGPAPFGRDTVPEPGPAQRVYNECTIGIWREDIFQLWFDTQTLWEIRNHIDANSLRVSEIDAALKEMTYLVDLELPAEQLPAAIVAGRKRLAPLLKATNGSTAPILFAFGHAHIDVAWLWPLRETEHKCVRTFSTQLGLMREYPEYRFLQSQPHLYQMVLDKYPELMPRIKAAAKKGQWIAEGAMWVEADTNVTGGESLIRQCVYGKKFFREEFGVDSQMLWLPDVFGYSGALPQILRGCGVPYFSTQKLEWAYGGGDPFPYNTFHWEGIDGSRVLTHIHTNYNSETTPANLMSRWNDRRQKDGIDSRLLPFGWGDGGGGSTRHHLEYLRRCKNLEGVPKTRIDHPLSYFRRQAKTSDHLPVYNGELYVQVHRGTYTSQAKTKLGNRRCEIALRDAELWGAFACMLGEFAYPIAQYESLWKAILLNQFHDIIPGSSIHRVYEEAEADYARVEAGAVAIADDARAALQESGGATAATVYNSLSWDRNGLVELPKGWRGATDEAGHALPTQTVNGTTVAALDAVPSCGWTTIRKGKADATVSSLKTSARVLENEHLRVKIGKAGELTSIRDKETGREWAAAPCNVFRLYKDVPARFDAWDIDEHYEQMPVDLGNKATVKLTAKGPLLAEWTVTRQLHDSAMTQRIRLAAGSRTLEFETEIDWQERHKLLKVDFPVTLRAEDAIHEIQFGHLRRPTHASRMYDADRFEVCQQKWSALCEEGRGFALLNDCKYGINVADNCMSLTLLKSALAPDPVADLGRQRFTYAMHCWNGPFYDADVVRAAYELNMPLTARPGASGTASLLTVDAPNIVIETVKSAEDCSGDLIVRLYEAKRTRTDCILTANLPVVSAQETDMLEQGGTKRACKSGAVKLAFRPFEIKTVRFKLG